MTAVCRAFEDVGVAFVARGKSGGLGGVVEGADPLQNNSASLRRTSRSPYDNLTTCEMARVHHGTCLRGGEASGGAGAASDAMVGFLSSLSQTQSNYLLAAWQRGHRGATAGNLVLAHHRNHLVQRQVRLLGDQSQQKICVLLRRRPAPAPRLGGAGAGLPKAFYPDNCRSGVHFKLLGRLTPRSPAFDLRDQSRRHVPRIGLRLGYALFANRIHVVGRAL
jgi:hypothetical protein